MPSPNPDLPPFDPARLTPVKRALISVSDKSRLIDQASALHERGVKLVSTGGTRKAIEAAGIPVKDVSELTHFPEMMDGRVKTLHPMVHGGLLALRDIAEAYGGMAVVARDAGITREALYRALSPTGNPTLKTLLAVLHAMDMRLSVTTGRTQGLTPPQGNTCRPA